MEMQANKGGTHPRFGRHISSNKRRDGREGERTRTGVEIRCELRICDGVQARQSCDKREEQEEVERGR